MTPKYLTFLAEQMMPLVTELGDSGRSGVDEGVSVKVVYDPSDRKLKTNWLKRKENQLTNINEKKKDKLASDMNQLGTKQCVKDQPLGFHSLGYLWPLREARKPHAHTTKYRKKAFFSSSPS